MPDRKRFINVRGGYSDTSGIAPCNTEMQLYQFDKRTRMMISNKTFDILKNVFQNPEKMFMMREADSAFCEDVISNVFIEPVRLLPGESFNWSAVFKAKFDPVFFDADYNICALFGAFMMVFRCECPRYMYYLLNSNIFSVYLNTFLTTTINQLTGKNFGNMNIVYCPDTVEQDEIVSFLDKRCLELDELIIKKKRLINALESYKKSLIYEYVTGKKEVSNAT